MVEICVNVKTHIFLYLPFFLSLFLCLPFTHPCSIYYILLALILATLSHTYEYTRFWASVSGNDPAYLWCTELGTRQPAFMYHSLYTSNDSVFVRPPQSHYIYTSAYYTIQYVAHAADDDDYLDGLLAQ